MQCDRNIKPDQIPTLIQTQPSLIPWEEGMDNCSYSLNSVNDLLMQITLTKFEKKSVYFSTPAQVIVKY